MVNFRRMVIESGLKKGKFGDAGSLPLIHLASKLYEYYTLGIFTELYLYYLCTFLYDSVL